MLNIPDRFLDREQFQYELVCECVVLGKLPSMKNRRRIIFNKGKPRLIKSKQAVDYQNNFHLQIPAEYKGLETGSLDEDLAIIIFVWYESRRPDLSVEMLFDCLQYKDKKYPDRSVQIIRDDRYIREVHAFGYVDKMNPRVEFALFRRFDK